jgi:hypothetical protein
MLRGSTAFALVVAAMLLWTDTSFAGAADARGRALSAEALTRQLVALENLHRRADRSARPALLDRLLAAAAERRALLASLVEHDPAQVLRVALPSGLRDRFPAVARAHLEEKVSLEGELETLYEDSHQASRLRYFLRSGGREYGLHFASQPPALPSGSRLRVSGVQLDDVLALASGETSVVPLEIAAEPTLEEKRVLVLLVNFASDPSAKPFTLEQAQQIVFGDTSDFLRENSFGQTWLTGDVRGWYTLPIGATCSHSQIASAADAAAGIDAAAYDSLIYVFPRRSCGWTGLATLGGSPGRVWINGRLLRQVAAHELGHNYGLYHSHGLECDTARTGSDCTNVDYGDRLDTMALVSADTDGVYLLGVYEAVPGSGPKALKIPKAVDPVTGAQTWYYLEYRQALGFDSFLAGNANVLNGVIIRTASEASGNSSFLLDMTPGSASGTGDFLDSALVVGDSFTSPDGDVTITTEWADGDQAAVSVSQAGSPCTPAAPSLTLSPAESQWVAPGTPVVYTASLTNHDDPDCSTSHFELQATAPAGWAAILEASSVALSPGDSASLALNVSSAANALDGFYTIDVGAQRGADAASGKVTYVVSSASANGTPVAVDDSGRVAQGSAVTIDVLSNDWDPDRDSLTIVSVTQGSRGSIVINPDSTVTYTNEAGGRGSDSFRYTITDGVGSATASVSIQTEKQSRGKRNGQR